MGSVVFVGHVSGKGHKPAATDANAKSGLSKETSMDGGVVTSSTATTPTTNVNEICGKMVATVSSSTSANAIANGSGGVEAVGGGVEGVTANAAVGAVDWHLFRNIAYAWIVTVPVTALLSAGIMFLMCSIVLA